MRSHTVTILLPLLAEQGPYQQLESRAELDFCLHGRRRPGRSRLRAFAQGGHLADHSHR